MSTVFVISAPSGSGKSTLVARLMRTIGSLHFSISYTTRSPRGQERDGEQYVFLSREDFERRVAEGEFLEHAEVFGNYYGTHRSQLEQAAASGCDLLVDIDVQGAAQLKKQLPDAVTIFVLAPSRAELEKRLQQRGDMRPDVIERRLQEAAEEVKQLVPLYDFVVINDDLDEAVATLVGIVRAERARTVRMRQRIEPLLREFGIQT
jgi:guanylate kinase